jgi:hypothetical protein
LSGQHTYQSPRLEQLDVAGTAQLVPDEQIAGKQGAANPVLDTRTRRPHADGGKKDFETSAVELSSHQLFAMAVGPKGIPASNSALDHFGNSILVAVHEK